MRWTPPGAPGIALQIVAQNTVADDVGLRLFMSDMLEYMARQNDHAPLRPGFHGYGRHFSFTICRKGPGNQALTWVMVRRVLLGLWQFMASGGGYRLLQYEALTVGLTPADDVLFGSGMIAMAPVQSVHVPAVVAPRAQGFRVELVGGGGQ